jgi:hypothetical protein
VALPEIGAVLGFSAQTRQWVISAYAVASAAQQVGMAVLVILGFTPTSRREPPSARASPSRTPEPSRKPRTRHAGLRAASYAL